MDLLNAFWHRAESNAGADKGWGVYLRVIKHARAFTLDDEAVEIIANMAFGGDVRDQKFGKRIDNYRQLARLPYPIMWLEFNYQVLHKWLVKHGIDATRDIFGPPERVGFLMDENSNEPEVYRITTLGRMADPKTGEMIPAAVFPSAQTVCTRQVGEFEITSPKSAGEVFAQAVKSGNYMGISSSVAWGLLEPDQHDNLGEIKEVMDHPLYKSSAVEPEAMWYDHMLESEDNATSWPQVMSNSIIEQRFDLRFIVAALALINHVPVRYLPYRKAGHCRPKFEQRPYMSTSIITIEVPATRRRVRDIERHLKDIAGGWHNRRHEVRGHWRVADVEVSDKWNPFYDPMTDKWRWRLWISRHERGDSTLGYVNQYHSVKGADKA